MKATISFKGHAIFSPCQRYRYWLERRLDGGSRTAVFAMLNPSTATAETNDPTIRRCMGFAQSWGCNWLVVVNIFAFRATDPKDMKAQADPIGPDNDRNLTIASYLATQSDTMIICAWGTHGKHQDRDRAALDCLSASGAPLYALGVTACGSPRHPLYLRSDSTPQPYLGRPGDA